MASRYEEHFGTLGKAAVYFAMMCLGSDDSACKYCPVVEDCDETLRRTGSFVTVRARIAEWLGSDGK